MLNVEMLSTGDEVLHGQIIDTNAAWLADFFFNQGLPLTRRNTVGDDLDALVAILRERSEQADVLIVNGGLGPTSDDLSALAAATAKGEGLILHPEWLETMTRFFAERGRPMAESNRKQAEIPASAEMINNPVGTACGFAIQLNRCLMFFTPGVPSEFKVMVEQEILPRLRQRFTLPDPPVCLRLTTFGRSESELAQSLNPLTLPPGVVMGYRSSMPIIELKLTGPANQRDAMLALWPEVRKVAGDSLIFEGTEGLPAQIARCLQERQLSLTLSEQFTGGLLALQSKSKFIQHRQKQIAVVNVERASEIHGDTRHREHRVLAAHGKIEALRAGQCVRAGAGVLVVAEYPLRHGLFAGCDIGSGIRAGVRGGKDGWAAQRLSVGQVQADGAPQKALHLPGHLADDVILCFALLQLLAGLQQDLGAVGL